MADSYTYRVRTREGKVVAGTMEADGEAAVASRLRQQGLIPVQITKEAKISAKTELHILPQKVGLKDIAVFSRQFATMISSGLSLLRTLNILTEQTENPLLARTVGEIRTDVERGSSLSAAMSKHPKVFNNLYISLTRAGETGGQLDTVLARVADSFEADYKLRQKVKSAMTYPVVVAGIAVLLVSAMLMFIVPTFANMFTGLGGELPLPTKLLMIVSNGAKFLIPIFFVFAIAGFIAYKRAHRASADFRFRADSFKLKVPIFGDLFQKIALSRFSKTLALLLRAGVPILQALDIVGESTGNEVLARSAQEVKESVRQGETMSEPLGRADVFPPMVVQMIAIGEDTGALDSMLDKVAEFYDQEVESTTESLTALIEPLMIGVLGGIVGGMVIALYLPMFKIFDLIK